MKILDKYTLLKSVIYRIFASFVTSSIAFLCTGKLTVSISIGIFEFFSKIFTYYIFETVWNSMFQIINSKSYRNNCYKFNKNGQCILISGLNCSGKTTLAVELSKHIEKCILLDGDAMRNGINYDLGFTEHDIRTNLQKISNMAKILMDQGYNVIISCISKNKDDREFIRQNIGHENYHEVHVDCDESVLRKRQNVLHPTTKILQTDYEESEYDVITVDSSKMDVNNCVQKVIEKVCIQKV